MEFSSKTLSVFADYVSNTLSQHGFTLIAPQLAERRAPGLRQGILLRCSYEAKTRWAYVSTYSAFTHELDDGPTCDRLTSEGMIAGEASGQTGAVERDLQSALGMMTRLFLPRLLRYSTVDEMLRDIDRYPGSAENLLGHSEIASLFNLAHCFETVGRFDEAESAYLDTVDLLSSNDDALSHAYANAAGRRCVALQPKVTGQVAAWEIDGAGSDDQTALVLTEADEEMRPFYAGLLRHLKNSRRDPVSDYPGLVLEVIDELYEARPNFWRSVSLNGILTVVKTYAPSFEQEMALLSPAAFEEYAEVLKGSLYMRAFDETSAERLLALPKNVRPKTRERVYNWLIKDFARRGEEYESNYLERDGLKGADGAISAMHRLLGGQKPG